MIGRKRSVDSSSSVIMEDDVVDIVEESDLKVDVDFIEIIDTEGGPGSNFENKLLKNNLFETTLLAPARALKLSLLDCYDCSGSVCWQILKHTH